MGSLLEHQADKSEESVENRVVGTVVGLLLGRTKGSQLGVGAVVSPALGLAAGIVLVASKQWLEWQKGLLDFLIRTYVWKPHW